MFFEKACSNQSLYSQSMTTTSNQQVVSNYMTLSLKAPSKYFHGEDRKITNETMTTSSVIPKPAPRKIRNNNQSEVDSGRQSVDCRKIIPFSSRDFLSNSTKLESPKSTNHRPSIKPLLELYLSNAVPMEYNSKYLITKYLQTQTIGTSAAALQSSDSKLTASRDLVSSADEDTEDSTDNKTDKPKVSFFP